MPPSTKRTEYQSLALDLLGMSDEQNREGLEGSALTSAVQAVAYAILAGQEPPDYAARYPSQQYSPARQHPVSPGYDMGGYSGIGVSQPDPPRAAPARPRPAWADSVDRAADDAEKSVKDDPLAREATQSSDPHQGKSWGRGR